MATIIGKTGSLEQLRGKLFVQGIRDFHILEDFILLMENPSEIVKNIKDINPNQLNQIRLARDIISQNETYYRGAIGEENVIKILKELPDTYYILNEAQLSFTRPVYWKKYEEYVKLCKIDHVAVGPTGIFLIETKYWTEEMLNNSELSPHKQIDRAGYIFFIHMKEIFDKKFPLFKIVVMYNEVKRIEYKYVYQLSLKELNGFILTRQGELNHKEIHLIVRWLCSNPVIYNDDYNKNIVQDFYNMIDKGGFRL